MGLTSQKIQIKKINHMLVTQSIIIQTLIDIITESKIITNNEFDLRIKKNIEEITNIFDSSNRTPSSETDEEEVMGGIYYGPKGEA